ncbi:MAG: FAD-dependent oxidoreductase [Thermomicrobiales bacterium]|nr:FAD-dependent oxidoreductase [Thermomicrobiales bacterium]
MTSAAAESVIVVGGGVIGSGIAFELAKRGLPVTLIERGRIGGEASWASAGIISLPHRPWTKPERVELGRISLERYPALVMELEERTGIGIDYRRPGEWAIAVDAEHARQEDAVAAWQRGLGLTVEDVAPDEARRLEPALPESLVAARFHPGVGSLSVYRLTQALAAAARQLGATILEETPVGGLLREGDRVTGVRLQDRDLHADVTLLATGAWTRLLGEGIGVTLPTLPVKGQLIAYADTPIRPARVISGHGGYVRPRPDGTTMVAATEEYVGFDRRVTGDGVAWLLELTRTLCPVLLQGEVAETWTGLRPGSETNDPLIGPVPGFSGLWVSAGHFRTGAKEAPATAELVAEALATGEIPPLLRAFDPAAQRIGG